MIANRAFVELIESHPGIAQLEVTQDFRTFVAGGFDNVEGAVFLRRLFSGDKLIALSSYIDRTGYECSVNSFHVEDYIERDVGREPATLAAFARLYAEFLATRLARFSNDTFRIIGTVSGQGRRTSTLRFHKLREGESWLADDLETYNQPLFYIDQPPGQ